ncbi:MAG: DUF2062 domain-containing protein [Desulfotomaculaceae bacterium]|nr:DUF2062 domain-containing protein [Desulfotomaculaceae bacterium]
MFADGILFFKKKISSPVSECLKNYYDKVMSLPDSPKKIARGVALGIAFDFLPIPIISIPLSYLAARLIRCSPLAAVATVCVFKPLVPVFFTINILVGKFLCGGIPETDVTISGFSFLGPYLEKVIEHGYPFLVGSLVNATLFSLAVYFLLLFLLERRRCQGEIHRTGHRG